MELNLLNCNLYVRFETVPVNLRRTKLKTAIPLNPFLLIFTLSLRARQCQSWWVKYRLVLTKALL